MLSVMIRDELDVYWYLCLSFACGDIWNECTNKDADEMWTFGISCCCVLSLVFDTYTNICVLPHPVWMSLLASLSVCLYHTDTQVKMNACVHAYMYTHTHSHMNEKKIVMAERKKFVCWIALLVIFILKKVASQNTQSASEADTICTHWISVDPSLKLGSDNFSQSGKFIRY